MCFCKPPRGTVYIYCMYLCESALLMSDSVQCALLESNFLAQHGGRFHRYDKITWISISQIFQVQNIKQHTRELRKETQGKTLLYTTYFHLSNFKFSVRLTGERLVNEKPPTVTLHKKIMAASFNATWLQFNFKMWRVRDEGILISHTFPVSTLKVSCLPLLTQRRMMVWTLTEDRNSCKVGMTDRVIWNSTKEGQHRRATHNVKTQSKHCVWNRGGLIWIF